MKTATTSSTIHPATTLRRWARHQRARRGITVLPATQPPLVEDLVQVTVSRRVPKIIGRGDALSDRAVTARDAAASRHSRTSTPAPDGSDGVWVGRADGPLLLLRRDTIGLVTTPPGVGELPPGGRRKGALHRLRFSFPSGAGRSCRRAPPTTTYLEMGT